MYLADSFDDNPSRILEYAEGLRGCWLFRFTLPTKLSAGWSNGTRHRGGVIVFHQVLIPNLDSNLAGVVRLSNLLVKRKAWISFAASVGHLSFPSILATIGVICLDIPFSEKAYGIGSSFLGNCRIWSRGALYSSIDCISWVFRWIRWSILHLPFIQFGGNDWPDGQSVEMPKHTWKVWNVKCFLNVKCLLNMGKGIICPDSRI